MIPCSRTEYGGSILKIVISRTVKIKYYSSLGLLLLNFSNFEINLSLEWRGLTICFCIYSPLPIRKKHQHYQIRVLSHCLDSFTSVFALMASRVLVYCAFALLITVASVNCNHEVDALIAWKNKLADPSNVLKSWDPNSADPSNWSHVTVNDQKNVTRVELGRARLAGPLVPELGNLTFLEYFVVFGNNINGTIPSEIGHLKKLIRLELQQNILTGPIPDSFGNLTALKFLDLSNNNLTGSIPVSLGQLATLQTLNLNSNNLTGTIPTEVLGLVRLAVIRLINVSNNKLDGSVHNSTSGLLVTSIVQDPKA